MTAAAWAVVLFLWLAFCAVLGAAWGWWALPVALLGSIPIAAALGRWLRVRWPTL